MIEMIKGDLVRAAADVVSFGLDVGVTVLCIFIFTWLWERAAR